MGNSPRQRHNPAGATHFGEDTTGMDVKAFGDTTGKYFWWDASADTLYVVGTLSLDGTFNADNIALIDAETLTFGTGLDVVMQWDGTNFIVAAAADDSLIEIGDSAATQKSFDLKWYANEASGASYLYFDAGSNLVYTTDVDLQFKDADLLVFGTGAGAAGDVNITWDGTNLIVAAVADDTIIEIGDSATTQLSFDLKWYAGEASGASYLYLDASENLIYTTGVDLQFKDNDVLVFGTGAGATGDIGITYDANSLNITPTAASDALEIGASGHVLNTALVGTFTMTGATFKHGYDAAAYWTATQADGGAVTFASVSDGTAGFSFSQKVDVTGTLTVKYGAADYVTMTQADAGTFTLDITTDGTPEFIFSDKVSVLSPLKVSFDAAAYMTITQADGAGVTFASVSDGTAGFAFSQVADFVAGLTVNTNKITLSPGATSGIGELRIGTTSAAQTLNANPGASVFGSTINILHSAGAGDCDDLIASYKKIAVTGDGDAGITIVGDAPRAYVGVTGGSDNSVASAAYASQPWAKHEGTGAITAMSALSALLDVGADNFTVNTINAGHFHIEGAATVTGQFDGVHIEVYPDVTCLDAGLAISVDSGAVVGAGIRISGSPVAQMLLSSGAKIFTGTAANEDAVYAEVGAVDATGSVYISSAGGIYIQVADAGADSDWNKISSTHT